jgi:hypothetical protein
MKTYLHPMLSCPRIRSVAGVTIALFVCLGSPSFTAEPTAPAPQTCVVTAEIKGDPEVRHQDMLHADPAHAKAAPHFDLHGQLILGEESLYLSHLPVFWFDPQRHPHNFQVIMEVTFSQEGSDPRAVYVRDRKAHSDQRVYTLAPEHFNMSDLLLRYPGYQPLRAFKGRVVRGHFEKPSHTSILDPVVVNVQNIVYFQEFDQQAGKHPQLEYLLFGKSQEFFLVHLISAPPPDFDQIARVTISGHTLTEDELRRGVRVAFPGQDNTAEMRLKAGERVACEVPGVEARAAGLLQLAVSEEVYCEEGELERPVVSNGFPPSRACRP